MNRTIAIVLTVASIVALVATVFMITMGFAGCSGNQRRDYNEGMAIACTTVESISSPVDSGIDPLVSVILSSMRANCNQWRSTVVDAGINGE